MTTAEWIMIAAVVIGPLIAVAISLWVEGRRRNHDAKLLTLRLLLTTRDVPSDPGYQVAVKLVPIEFNDCPAVLSAHREFLDATNVSIEDKSEEDARAISGNMSIKLTRLLFEMSKAAGLKIRETDIQTGTFGTRGFVYRDQLLQDSQKAMRDIAEILWMQTRLLRGDPPDQIFASTEAPEVVAKAEPVSKKKK